MQLHHSSGKWRLGLILALIAVFMWGVLPIPLTLVLKVLDVYTVTWFRFLGSFTILAIYLASKHQLPNLKELHSSSWKLIAIAALFLGMNYLLFLQGLKYTSPSFAEVLIQLAPVLMGLGAIAVFKEHFTTRQWTGLGVLTVGFVLFFQEQLRAFVTASDRYIIGSGLIILASAAWAIYALSQKQLLQKLPSSSILLLIYGSCTLLYTPLATPQTILHINLLQLGLLIFCAFNTLIAYGAFAESLEHWEASKVGAVTATTPIVTLVSVELLAIITPNLIAPENLTLLAIIGAILVIAGSVAIALGKPKQ